MTLSIRSALTLWSTILSLAACTSGGPVDSPSCVGTCGVCAPAITLRVDLGGATVTAISDASVEALTCSSHGDTTYCQSDQSLGPGTYIYDVTARGRTQRVTVTVERGPVYECCDCGYDPVTVYVTLVEDGGIPSPRCVTSGDTRTCECSGGAGPAITLACAAYPDDDTCYTYTTTCADDGFYACSTANFAELPLLEARCRAYCATDGGVPAGAPCDGW